MRAILKIFQDLKILNFFIDEVYPFGLVLLFCFEATKKSSFGLTFIPLPATELLGEDLWTLH